MVLETSGGSLEVTERIADVFRQHYRVVDFMVPDQAYSAGTVLCMSGDNIYMDYFSVLGPVDPQILMPNGTYMPATGYLEKYDELVEKSSKGTITNVEAAYMIAKFDPVVLCAIEQDRMKSVDMIEKWLVKYKFKDWTKTDARGIKVTREMKKERARDIANALNNTKKWRSHGRGIPMKTLTSEDMKLLVEDFGKDEKLNKLVRDYHDLITDYSSKNRIMHFLHSEVGLTRLTEERKRGSSSVCVGRGSIAQPATPPQGGAQTG